MSKSYFPRNAYLKKVRSFYDDAELIKVITGVRRCGKSSLMKTIAQEILDGGAKAENVIYLDLDKRGYRKKPAASEAEEKPAEKKNAARKAASKTAKETKKTTKTTKKSTGKKA